MSIGLATSDTTGWWTSSPWRRCGSPGPSGWLRPSRTLSGSRHGSHSDGNPITPDFAVLFNDATGLVVELSNLARNTESLEALVGQIARYNEVHELPAGPPRLQTRPA